MKKVILTLEYDEDYRREDIDEYWKLVSFNSRHYGYEDPYKYLTKVNKYGEIVPANIGIKRKIDCGTAFWLSYFEHGQCEWSLKGHGYQCRWDTTQIAGILLWDTNIKELPKTFEKREKWAESYLEAYTSWSNGEIYYYSIEDEESGKSIESCGGFLGNDDDMFKLIKEQTKGYEIVRIKGNAKDLADYHDLQVKEELV